jgi:hypothetical protein
MRIIMKSISTYPSLIAASFFMLCVFSKSAAGQTVTVSCSPCSGPPGTVVQVTLSGFSALGAQLVAASDPGGGGEESGISGCGEATLGNCTTQIVMPGVVVPTVFYFVASGDFPTVTSSTTFVVLPPSLVLSPTCGVGGTAVTVTGRNFDINDTVDLMFGSSGNLLGTAMTDANGNFSQPITIPQGSQSGLITASTLNQFTYAAQEFTTPSCTQIGKVTEIVGLVTAGGQTLSVNSPVYLDGSITTGPGSTVTILMEDNTTVVLAPQSTFEFDQYQYNSSATPPNANGSFLWRSLVGSFYYVSGLIGSNANPPPDNKLIETPFGYTGIRGTQFIAWPGTVPNSVEIDLLTGSVALYPNQAALTPAFTGPLTIVMSATGTTTSPLTTTQYNTILNNLFPSPSSDTTPPAVTVTFPVAPATQAGYFNGGQIPVQGTVTATDHSNVTAISCLDTLSGLTEGTLTGGGTATASRTLSATGNGTNGITCTATDGVGNAGAAAGSANTASIGIDATPPSISGAATPVANAYGWNNTNITVNFTCSDLLSGVSSCPSATTLSAEGAAQSVTGTATDKAGNSAQAKVGGISIDKTAPTVTYTGNAGTYTTTQTIAITCTASDALSGVATTTCANINGPGSSFGVGIHNYSATATDKAGNTGTGSTSFTVAAPVTFQSLIQLVDGWETVPIEKAEMDVTLLAADAAFAVKDNKLGDSLLNAFIQEVSSQSGKSLTAPQAAHLIQDAQTLLK